jgi:Dock homology region 2
VGKSYSIGSSTQEAVRRYYVSIHSTFSPQATRDTRRFEYSKLAEALTREAKLFRDIVEQERFFCEYFRVGYYGRGFDSQIQGKEFIYRGFELERLADFIPVSSLHPSQTHGDLYIIQRILLKFPHAIILNYTELPPPEVINGEGLCIKRKWVRQLLDNLISI